MQNSLIYNNLFNHTAWLISGILYGLGCVLLPHIWLFWLVWFAFVPILLHLKYASFKRWFLSVLLMNNVALGIMFIPAFKVTWTLSLAAVFSQALFLTTPWLILWFFRQQSWGIFILPFLWVSNEWLLTFFPLSIPTILGTSQVENYFFIQYYDLIGVFGGSFWIILLNIFLVHLILNGFNKRKLFQITIIMFVLPLVYSAWIFYSQPTHIQTIKAGIIQTGLKPTRDWSYLYKLLSLSDKLLHENKQVDLIIWSELALGWNFWDKEHAKERQLLFEWIASTRVPIFLGTLDRVPHQNQNELSALAIYKNQDAEIFSIATLITPEFSDYALNQSPEIVLPLKTYQKHHLFPFAEKVPFVEYFPQLAYLLIEDKNLVPINLSTGRNFTVFNFSDQQQKIHQIGALLCYEAFFPEISTYLTSMGAQTLVILTNDDSNTLTEHSYYSLAIHSRIRAIETRRDIARVGTTGFSLITNRFGQIEKISQPFQEDIFTHNLILNNKLSFYVKYPYLFPIFCIMVSLMSLMSLLNRMIF